ncbi:MAG: flavoprotein oxidoreductase [Actinobacteria bacterium]|nr:MAG: flavoprotein oxidoreductase [Actinomycetota bacterium]
MGDRLAIVGGDAAGMSAATNALRRDPGLDVIAFERSVFTSYSACGIPYFVGGLVDAVDDLVARSPESHRANGIDVRTNTEVVGIDLDRRELALAGGGVEPFDRLVVATGARAVPPRVPGADATEPARTLDAAVRLRRQVGDGGHHDAVVVGAGYIGLEMAEAFAMRGLHVALVERADEVFPVLDADMGARVREAAERIGIEVHTSTLLEEVLLDDAGEPRGVRTTAGELAARHVVVAVGVRPDVELAAAAGLRIGPTGALAVDDHQRCAGADGVWAAGDCVESRHLLLDRPVNIQLGTHANKQGRVAGHNAAGGDLAFPGVVGTAISRLCRREVALTGLTETLAAEAGYDAYAATIETSARAGYYPGNGPVWVKLVAERGTGRVLGAQIVGAETAAKRIDTVAMAVWTGMAVDELQWVDLGYAPPVSGVLDPVLVAARVAAKNL